MYRIKLSNNMIRQGFIPPRESFKTGREAYEHGIAKCMELLKIKGKLAEEKQKNISFGDVVAELLKAYKETEEGEIPPNKNTEE